MKKYSGNLRKMKGVHADPIEYYLRLNDQEVPLNSALGQTIQIAYNGNIHCIQCGRKTNKSFQQGYCFPCMRRLNECDMCVIHPERCHVEKGTCPQDDWAHRQCYQQHVVYLANSSGLKIGITRFNHQPSRWIDQGAVQALPIFQVANRYQSGVLEVAFKSYVNDKTNWRTMLKQDVAHIDLVAERDRLLTEAAEDIDAVIQQFDQGSVVPVTESNTLTFRYPVEQYPTKVSSLSLDKTPEIEGTLQGIKGQYLILDIGVLNIRKFGGYEVTIKV